MKIAGRVPETRYADADGVKIAYQAFGDGPVDIVLVPGFISHIEIAWEEPFLARFLSRLSTFSRVLFFDKRGTGLSDRTEMSDFLNLDRRADDVAAVMTSAGSKRAVLFAWSEGGPSSLIFASRFPERTQGLILAGTTAKFEAEPGYPGVERWLLDSFAEACEEDWGNGVFFDFFAPSLREDEQLRAWWARYQRFCASPSAVAASIRMHVIFDGRPLLAGIRAPTLVLHHADDLILPVACGRYLADHIAGAQFQLLEGADHMYWVRDQDTILGHVRTFLESLPDVVREPSRRRAGGLPTFGWEALTPVELEIVELVRQGESNRVISERLSVSSKTVEAHLTHVFDKLGVDSRARLATEATQIAVRRPGSLRS